MRSHTEIVTSRGATKLRADLSERGVLTSLSTTQRWSERNSIPPKYWPHIIALGIASLEELAAAPMGRATGEPQGAAA